MIYPTRAGQTNLDKIIKTYFSTVIWSVEAKWQIFSCTYEYNAFIVTQIKLLFMKQLHNVNHLSYNQSFHNLSFIQSNKDNGSDNMTIMMPLLR